jgi:hypothetical protein
MEFSELVKPLGIVTYSCLVLTFLAGFFRAKLKLKPKRHKLLAWVTVGLASLHALLVIVYY